MLSRRVAAILPWGMLATAALVGGLAAAVRGRRALALDRWADHRLIHTGSMIHHLANGLRDIGDPRPFVALAALVIVLWALVSGWGPALTIGCGLALDLVVIEKIFKPLVARRPPFGGGDTFPSGHTGAAFSLSISVLVLLGQPAVVRHTGRAARAVVGVVLLLIATGVGVAMVVTQAHYLTDVIAGAPIGIMSPLLVAWLYDLILRRRSTHRGPGPQPVSERPVSSALR